MGYKTEKSLLIYMDKSILKPTGGPIGYNFNLYNELMKKGYENIYYIESGREKIESWKNRIDSINNPTIKKVLIVLKKAYKHFKLLYGKKHLSYVDLEKFDFVHFHSTLDVFDARDSLKNYTGKVILTSHSPTLLSKEIYDGATWFEKNICGFIYNNLIKVDEYAFSRADYIIFPCEDAEEPYYHAWPSFKQLKETRKEHFKYLVSGIQKCSSKTSKEEIRRKYGIPQDAFLISYVGRHNQIKGYDLLKKYCVKYIESHENVYVIVAGKETPLHRPESSKWIEVGWTDDPHSIIAASDVFVLPNRETYFDLIMLEVLSLGKIVVASETGGNKYFKNSGQVYTYNNENEIIAALEKIQKMTVEEKEEKEMEIKNYFDDNFDISIFAENYVKLINSL